MGPGVRGSKKGAEKVGRVGLRFEIPRLSSDGTHNDSVLVRELGNQVSVLKGRGREALVGV